MNLTLASVFHNPQSVTYTLHACAQEQFLLRPLQRDDVDTLALFLSRLSPSTRHFSFFPSYDEAMAQELCAAIDHFDKLRLVVESLPGGEIVGLMEFSFAIPEGDTQRFAAYGLTLDAASDCRFGPVLADSVQNSGLGSTIFPHIVDIARRFGKRRIVLWGGVLADNARAIHFYKKQGFRPLGHFVDFEGLDTMDMILDLEDDVR